MRALVGTAALLLALAGCGDGEDDDSDDVRACSDLTGETITDEFDGCMEGDQLRTVAGAHDCMDGRVLVVVSDDTGWAFEDEEWHTGTSDDGLSECSGLDDVPEEPTDEVTDEPTDESSDEATDEPSDEPASSSSDCADVWIEGATLPADYVGCQEGPNEVPAALFQCGDGSELTGYDDRFYAFLGGEIMPSSDEEAYAAAFAECVG